jgi:hypothetical protein
MKGKVKYIMEMKTGELKEHGEGYEEVGQWCLSFSTQAVRKLQWIRTSRYARKRIDQTILVKRPSLKDHNKLIKRIYDWKVAK